MRFVGEAVAMCVAATRAEGEDLAARIELELEPLPAVVDAIAGRDAPAALVHEAWKDNLFLQTAFDKGIAEAAATAPVVVRRSYRMARQVMNPLEGKAVLAHWDARTDQLVVYTSTQVPHMIRTAIAEHLGIAQGSVRVIAPDVGGAFGYKCVLQPEELCVAWLALKFKTPFRWIEDRREHLISGANCREHHYAVTAYADERGKLLGVDAEITVDAGAYSVWPFTSCLESTMAARHLPGPYALPAYRVRTSAVATNKPPIVPYRGVARTGICFAIELTIDAVARAVGREACDVRRENLVPAAAMPFVTVTGNAYDSGDYRRSLDLARERVDLPAIRARQAKADGDTLIGVGFANYIEMTAHGTALFSAAGYPFTPGHEQAAVRFTPDGGLEIRVGVHSHGQGMETSLAQIAHEVLGIPVAAIAVVLGDTAMTPYSTGTYASRSITMAGGAVARACEILKRRLAAIAAHLLQCTASDVALRAGIFYGPTGDIAVRDVAATWYLHPQRLPPDADGMDLQRHGSHRRLQAEGRQRPVQLRHPRRGGRDRSRARQCAHPRLRDRRGLRDDGEPDDRGGADPGRGGAGHRHRAVRGDGVRRQRAAAGVDARRLHDAGRDRHAAHQHPPHRDAVAAHRLRHQGRGRRRRHPAAGRHLQCGERCPARAGRRIQRDAADAAQAGACTGAGRGAQGPDGDVIVVALHAAALLSRHAAAVIPGRAERREPGIYNHRPWLWIPGPPLRGVPE